MLYRMNERSFLCGSVHMGFDQMYPLPDQVYEAVKSCKHLAIEAVPGGADPSLYLLPDGVTVSSMLKGPALDAVKKFCEAAYFPLKNVEKLTPTAAFSHILAYHLVGDGVAFEKGTELHLIPHAKNVFTMEGHKFLAEIIRKIDNDPRTHSVIPETIDFMLSINIMDQLLEMWDYILKGDYDGIFNMRNMAFIPEWAKEELLLNRNRGMANKAEFLDKDGGVFVHPGAGHIGGPRGIIPILRERGHKIEKVS